MLSRSYRLFQPFAASTRHASQETRAQHNPEEERKTIVIRHKMAHQTPLNQHILQVINKYVSLDKTFTGIVLHAFNGGIGYPKNLFWLLAFNTGSLSQF